MNTFGFIGVGNMGGAMLKRIANTSKDNIYIYDVNEKLYENFTEVHVQPVGDLKELLEKVSHVVLTVKPQYYQSVCETLQKYLKPHHTVITVAPGISVRQMKEMLNEEVAVIRTMPNTPAQVGCGVTAYCFEKEKVSKESIEWVVKHFESFGMVYEVEESQMEAVVAVSGSSPAYGYMFIEAMADAAVKFGMPRHLAYEMAAQSLKGAAEMVLQTKTHPAALKDAVTSPGGTTIEAVAKLEETGFRHSVISSMTSCYNKAKMMNSKQ